MCINALQDCPFKPVIRSLLQITMHAKISQTNTKYRVCVCVCVFVYIISCNVTLFVNAILFNLLIN
jgi:hypothetical protein